MTYLLKRRTIYRENNLENYKKIGGVIAFAALLGSIFYFWSGLFSPWFVKILVPVSDFFSRAAHNIELGLQLLEPKSSLIRDNETLRKKTVELEAKVLDYYLLTDENTLLRENLNLASHDFALAAILLMPPKTPYDSLFIDRGKESGVFAGAQVLLRDRVALGYVEEVYQGLSKVRMFSSSGIKTSAILQRDGTAVELEGRGGGNFFLEAPLDFDVREGDIFFIPGSKRIVVAVADKVAREKTSSFIKILLRAPLPISGGSALLVEIK